MIIRIDDSSMNNGRLVASCALCHCQSRRVTIHRNRFIIDQPRFASPDVSSFRFRVRFIAVTLNPKSLSWIVFRVWSERKKIVALFSTDSARDLESRGFASQLRSSWIAFFRFLRAFLCGSCWKANIFSRNSSRGRPCSTKLVPCKHEFPGGILDSSDHWIWIEDECGGIGTVIAGL